MKRRTTSVDATLLLSIRQLTLEKQQLGFKTQAHIEVDRALRKYIDSEKNRIATIKTKKEGIR